VGSGGEVQHPTILGLGLRLGLGGFGCELRVRVRAGVKVMVMVRVRVRVSKMCGELLHQCPQHTWSSEALPY